MLIEVLWIVFIMVGTVLSLLGIAGGIFYLYDVIKDEKEDKQ